jgi:hypothetical protein
VTLFVAFQASFNVAVRRDWLPLQDPIYAEKFDCLRGQPLFFDPAPVDGTVRLLVVGSSRTQLGLDASRLTADLSATAGRPVRAFNFGTSGAGPLTTDLYFRRLLAAGCRPEAVLVEIHQEFVAAGPGDEPFEGRWLHAYRLRAGEAETLRRLGYGVGDPPHLGWRGWLAAAHEFRLPILNAYAVRWLPCPYGLTIGVKTDPFGWVGGLDVTPDDRRRLLAGAYEQYHPVFAGYRVGGAGAAAVRDMLVLCRANGIRTAVYVTAESSEFRTWYGPAGPGEVEAFARGLGTEFGIPVYDAREWVPDDGFADGHHMTPAGAGTFTARLARETGPWIRGIAEGR